MNEAVVGYKDLKKLNKSKKHKGHKRIKSSIVQLDIKFIKQKLQNSESRIQGGSGPFNPRHPRRVLKPSQLQISDLHDISQASE